MGDLRAGALEGQGYKFELLDAAGNLLPLKADPFGFAAELRPNTASRIARIENFTWSDGAYLQARQTDQRRAPMSIYEVQRAHGGAGPTTASSPMTNWLNS